ncbi:hypothetical protein LAZ40_10940 [Cereibacter sphaeroides]|uniref:hypothetical protein n=1 Tax=Cereibacter sphaeroides TaxID=1063 RepID=UPI001F454F88|nr:hypothetical protein [Cereibacter sphaeroides]MCE6959571.1 hypothetical protein [Cereibacter sphaeroides]MCE6974569.1 hypothetical protein [Cereibacter sphaeroides]
MLRKTLPVAILLGTICSPYLVAAGEGPDLSFAVEADTSRFGAAGQDISPDGFSLAAVTAAEPGATVTSGTITVTGIDGAVDAWISGSDFASIHVNDRGSVRRTRVRSGDRLRLSLVAPAEFEASRSVTLTVGTSSATFRVTTRAADVIPNPFVFASAWGADPEELVSSDPVTVTGFERPVAVTISGEGAPLFRLNGGAWVAQGTIEPADQLEVRLTAAASYGFKRTATVVAGGVAGSFDVTTKSDTGPIILDPTVDGGSTGTTGPAPVPEPISLSARKDVWPSGPRSPIHAESNEVRLRMKGGTGTVPVAVTGSAEADPALRVNGGPWTTRAAVGNGDRLQVRVRTGDDPGETTSAMVTLGDLSTVFHATTAGSIPPGLLNANALGFEAGICPRGAPLTWAPKTVSGMKANGPAMFTITGSGSPMVERNGNGSWVTTLPKVYNGDELRFRMTGSVNPYARLKATIRLGNGTEEIVCTTGS